MVELQADVDPTIMENDTSGNLDLRAAIGVLEDSDSEDEEEKMPHVGSKASLADAQKQVLEGVKARRTEMKGSSTESSLNSAERRSSGSSMR